MADFDNQSTVPSINFDLLKNITDAKIRSELNKIDDSLVDQKEKMDIFAQFDIANLVGVIK